MIILEDSIASAQRTVLDNCRVSFLDKLRTCPGPCWEWTGPFNTKGYGHLRTKQFGYVLGHRLSYASFKGPCDNGLEIHHVCENKCCVNPDHLQKVTHSVNMSETIGLGVSPQTHCKSGKHLLSEVGIMLRKNGRRLCVACRTASQNKRNWARPIKTKRRTVS